MKINFKRNSLALAMGLLGLGAVTGNAHAGAYTFSASQVTIQLFNTDGSAVSASQFSNLVVHNTSSTAAALTSGSDSHAGLTTGDALQSSVVVTGPTPPAAENTFAPVGNGTWYARGDANETGSVITDLPNAAPGIGSVISEISLNGTDIGLANANTNNDSGFVFTLAGDPLNPDTKQIRVDLSATTDTRSSLHPNAIVPPSIAGSSATWLMTVTDNVTGGTVFSWTPNNAAGGILGGIELSDSIALNFGSTVSAAGADTGLIHNAGSASALSPLLVTGRNYTFRIVQNTSSNAQDVKPERVPEPSILGLMGIGMLGASATWLRRTKKA